LIDFSGRFIGMNFYDKKIGTPFMFRDCIIRVRRQFKEEGYVHLGLLFCILKCQSCVSIYIFRFDISAWP
jgi:hypothetical protein